jgi:hypothetical protein
MARRSRPDPVAAVRSDAGERQQWAKCSHGHASRMHPREPWPTRLEWMLAVKAAPMALDCRPVDRTFRMRSVATAVPNKFETSKPFSDGANNACLKGSPHMSRSRGALSKTMVDRQFPGHAEERRPIPKAALGDKPFGHQAWRIPTWPPVLFCRGSRVLQRLLLFVPRRR